MPDPAPATIERTAPAPPSIAAIEAVACALPERRVGNEEIAAPLAIAPEWISERTGVRERRVAGGDETLAELAGTAGRRALAVAGVDPERLDLVLVASFTQDALLPNAAPLVAAELGACRAGACDVGAACTGFLTGLALASAQIESRRAEHVLVVGADLPSRVLDYGDRKTAGLFGDGAGAALLGAGGPGRVGRILLRSDAAGAGCISAGHDERLLRMRGQDVFRAAVDRLAEVTLEVLERERLEPADVDAFVYHQANARITGAVGERLGLPSERVVDCIAEQGNTSAATLPLALCDAAADGMLEPGSTVLVATFGAGYLWGGGLLDWDAEVGW